MVHGGETFENSSADRAEDEQGWQAGVAHHGASQQAASLIAPLEAPRKDTHEPVRERDAGVLVPPPVHHQGHVETWKQQKREETHVFALVKLGSLGFPVEHCDQQVTLTVASRGPTIKKNVLALLLHKIREETETFINDKRFFKLYLKRLNKVLFWRIIAAMYIYRNITQRVLNEMFSSFKFYNWHFDKVA